MIRFPEALGVSPKRVPSPVQNLDLLPTVLAALEITAPGPLYGVDLLAAWDVERVIFSACKSELAARSGTLTLMTSLWNRRPMRLYDLALEKDEMQPIEIDLEDPRIARLIEAVRVWRQTRKALKTRLEDGDSELEMDEDLMEQLRELGYL